MATEFFNRVSDNLITLGKRLKALPILDKKVSDVDEIVSNINSPMLIMVMGEFSTGKSSFINALVKRDIAAVGAQPTTAVITKLSYGNEDKIEVFFRDGTRKFFSENEFSKLTSERLNKEYDELHSGIDYVSRTLPIEILKNITIIDSPGLNALKPFHAATTRDFMDKADSVIWLFDANTSTKQSEIDALKRLNPRLSPLVILNKIDAVDEEEEDSVESIIADIERKLRNNKIQVQKIIGVSSKLAFEGARRSNAAMLSSSNISEFYNFVNNKIVPNRDAFKQNSLFDEIAELIGDIYEELRRTNTRNEFLHDENPAAYVEACRNVKELENSLMSLFTLFKAHAGANSDASEKYLLGSFYYNLAEYTNTQENYSVALNLYRKAAELGHTDSMVEISGMYGAGKGVTQNNSEMINWFNKAAESGNDTATYGLGALYMAGLGVTQDYREAFKYFEKASVAGDEDATTALALLYLNGWGVTKDINKACSLYRKAADAGNADAMFKVASMYGDGIGVAKSETEMFKWALKSAAAGNSTAMFLLSGFYVQEKNLDKANYWLKEAAVYGDDVAMNGVGTAYRDGKFGFKRNPQNALKWFTKAADAGNAEAMFNIGYMYYEGDGITENISKAFNLFKQSAENDYSVAFYWVGWMYQNGAGVTKNKSEAFKWLKKSVDSGDERAFCNLGLLYYHGEGVSKDYFEAFKLIKKAADNGDDGAYFWLGVMYVEGNGVSKSYSEALKWFRKGSDSGDGYSMRYIANMYRYGLGVSRDCDTALSWYRKAIGAGNEGARTAKAELESEIEAERERQRQAELARQREIERERERERERQRALTTYSNSSPSYSSSSSKKSSGGAVAGGVIGFAVGGPLGALAGAFIGSLFDD